METVHAEKVYRWVCPHCKTTNLASEPWLGNQHCHKCQKYSMVEPLHSRERILALADSLVDEPTVEGIIDNALFECQVKKNRYEHVKKVIRTVMRDIYKERNTIMGQMNSPS